MKRKNYIILLQHRDGVVLCLHMYCNNAWTPCQERCKLINLCPTLRKTDRKGDRVSLQTHLSHPLLHVICAVCDLSRVARPVQGAETICME